MLEGLIRELLKILERYPEASYFGGVGSTVSRLSELSRCSEEANRAFAYRYIRKSNQIVRSEDREEENSQEELKLSTLNVNQIDRKIAENFLRTGLKGETRHFLDRVHSTAWEGTIWLPSCSGSILPWICILLL